MDSSLFATQLAHALTGDKVASKPPPTGGPAPPGTSPTPSPEAPSPSPLDPSGLDASGSGGWPNWIGNSLAGGLAVAFIFICAQNLVFLTTPQHLSMIPTNPKAPPYSPGMPPGIAPTFANKILYGYGPPYSFKDNPTVFPFIPCNYPIFRNFFGIKHWLATTFIKTWVNSRKLLKVVLGSLAGLPKWLIMGGGFLFILLIICSTPLVALVFTITSSFAASTAWSVLGMLGLLLLIIFIMIAQLCVATFYLLFSPFMSKEGRLFINNKIQTHKHKLRMVFILLVVALSPMYIPPMYTLGMVIGIILLGV